MAVLAGIHPVREALKAGRPLERLLIAKGSGGPRIREILEMARRQSVPVRFEPREALERAGGAAHQGVVALAAAHGYQDLEAVAGTARLLVILDGVEDPHNLGAIIRTACAAGAGAVCIPERRAAGLTETVAKAAAGALEYLPVVRIGNLARTLEDLKRRGFWIYGLDERGATSYEAADWTRRLALVLGGEGGGIHQNVRRHCDLLLRIPTAGPISSLNVSVAAAVVLFEWRRRLGAPSR